MNNEKMMRKADDANRHTIDKAIIVSRIAKKTSVEEFLQSSTDVKHGRLVMSDIRRSTQGDKEHTG